MRFLDSTLSYTKPQLGGGYYTIVYKGSGQYSGHDHNDYFVDPPNKAKPGEQITVNLNSQNDTNYNVKLGIVKDGTQVTSSNQLEQSISIETSGSLNDKTYTFTMPDYNIEVWIWCFSSTHVNISEPVPPVVDPSVPAI